MVDHLSVKAPSDEETSAVLEFRDVSLRYQMSGQPLSVIDQVSFTVGQQNLSLS